MPDEAGVPWFSVAGSADPAPGCGTVRVSHRLAEEPLWDDAALAALAAGLPRAWSVPYDAGRTTSGDPDAHALPAVTGPEALVRLQTRPTVLRLLHLELTPTYRTSIRAMIEQGADAFTAAELPLRRHSSVLYVSSPGAVVPAHVDRHHNLFAQLRGVKRLSVGRFPDPAHQREVEGDFASPKRSPARPPSEDVLTYELGPGDGVYIPPYTFHWVEGGDEMTVSAACSWSTDATVRAEAVRRANAQLRRVRVNPKAPGAVSDRFKAATVAVGDRLRSAVKIG